MKIMLVDDEPLALVSMEHALNKLGDIQIAGCHTDPRSALAQAQVERLDAAFIDIEMPEISGMVLAEQLLQLQPNLSIVFVTAFDEYALEAFEVNALDYLLKPVQSARLFKTLERLRMVQTAGVSAGAEMHTPGMLCVFPNLHYCDNGGMKQSFPWRTVKAQELFAYLLLHREGFIRKEMLIDRFWYEQDPNKSAAQLYTTIYQTRQMLKKLPLNIELIYVQDGYKLLLHDTLLDAHEWEWGIARVAEVTAETIDEHLRLMAMYKGDYLSESVYLWAENERERLRLLWWNHVKQIAEYYRESRQYAKAAACYLKMQEKFPLSEAGSFGLIQMYDLLGNHGEVKQQFDRLAQRLQDELGVLPSREVQDWYKSWMNTAK